MSSKKRQGFHTWKNISTPSFLLRAGFKGDKASLRTMDLYFVYNKTCKTLSEADNLKFFQSYAKSML